MDDIPVNDGVPLHDEGPLDDSAPVNPCDDCGRTAAGQYSKDGAFYCFDCWEEWDPSGDDMIERIRDPDSIPFHEYMYKNNYDYDKIKDRFNPERPFGTAIPNMIIQYGIYKGQRPISRALFYRDTKLFDLFMDHGANPLLKDRKYKLSAKDFVEDCKGFLSFAVDHGLATVGDEKYLQLTKNCKYYNKRINLYMTTAAKKIQTKARSKLTKKKKAATNIQSKIRGKQTRSNLYISKFKKYKPWKGTKAFDTIVYDDEDVFTYLRESDRNFVIKSPGHDNYEAWNIDDYFKMTKIDKQGVHELNKFYECKKASGLIPAENVIRGGRPYIKLGSSNFVVKVPEWLRAAYHHQPPASRRGSDRNAHHVRKSITIPEPRIFELDKDKMVNALVSSDILDHGANWLSGDHCNHGPPVQTYTLKLLDEETMQADFLEVVDEYGAKKKKKKKAGNEEKEESSNEEKETGGSVEGETGAAEIKIMINIVR